VKGNEAFLATIATSLSQFCNYQPAGLESKHAMKAVALFLLSCASVFAQTGELRVYRTAHTNDAQSVYVRDAFTRDGQTNLVRVLKITPEGWSRIFHFYSGGQVVGSFVSWGDSGFSESTFNTEAGPHCMSLNCGAGGEMRSARIGDSKGVLLDQFSYTNGTFTPVEESVIDRANAKGEHMKPKFSPAP